VKGVNKMHAFALELEVECDGDAEQAPCLFRVGSRAVRVAEVVDRWPALDHVYVRLRGDDGAAYVLRHDLVCRSWQLALYRHGRLTDGQGLPSEGHGAGRRALAH
jgi:hypothetical protein